MAVLVGIDPEITTWVSTYDDGSALDADAGTQYLYSVYWALTTLTTVGYGDITPTNNLERLYSLFALLTGALVFGYGAWARAWTWACMDMGVHGHGHGHGHSAGMPVGHEASHACCRALHVGVPGAQPRTPPLLTPQVYALLHRLACRCDRPPGGPC